MERSHWLAKAFPQEVQALDDRKLLIQFLSLVSSEKIKRKISRNAV
jgi:hypothetical protein